MLARILMILTTAFMLSTSDATAQPSGPGFWVARNVTQGMSESDFYAFAKQAGIEVTTPFDKSILLATIDDTKYWLTFCDGSLTYASWILPDNKTFHRSMDKWINDSGFQLSEMRVSAEFNDRTNETTTKMALTLTRADAKFSVTYNQFAENSQIMLEDVRYDQTYGCTLDGSN